jgi:6-phosphogluconolactonase (cycloisomerase 2 family)
MNSYLYTTSNRKIANAVVGMKILENGSLQFIGGSPFPTGGKGLRSAESQNAIWKHQRLLYVVDAGSNSLAIFRQNADGVLSRLNEKPIPSRGRTPCSVCAGDGILYVLNKGDAKARASIATFAIEGENIRHLPKSSVQLGRSESPTQVIVNRQGTLLAVPSMSGQGSLLHCYEIDKHNMAEARLLTELKSSPFAITGGDFGFGSAWKSDGNTFFMTNAVGDASMVRLTIDAASGQIKEDARAAAPGTACWSALSIDENKLYVTNASSVIVFDVTGSKLDLVQTVDVADVSNPVLHDVILGPDGKFLYAIEQRKRRILIYSIAKDGRVTRSGELVLAGPVFPLGLAIG